MKNIILHIGRHKSGTTTLQKFLMSNRELLKEHGYYYPDFGIRVFAHHQIGELLSNQNIKKLGNTYPEVLAQSLAHLEAEIDCVDDTVVVSSEAFQNCDPKIVREYFKDFNVKVVVYLREQAGYLVSSYAQKVHATSYTGSMEEFYNSIFFSNYDGFLKKWKRSFGSNILVRIFDRSCLLNGDVVYDFAGGILDIPESDVNENYGDIDANPTLTRRLLGYKLYLNELDVVPSNMMQRIYRGLSELSKSDDSGKVMIPEKLHTRVLGDCLEGNLQVAREYFDRSILFENGTGKYETNTGYQLSDDELRSTTGMLIGMYPELAEFLPNDRLSDEPIRHNCRS